MDTLILFTFWRGSDKTLQQRIEKQEALKELIEKKHVVFLENFESKLEVRMAQVEKQIDKYVEELEHGDPEKLRIEVLHQLASAPKILSVDSLGILSEIPWDSIAIEILEEVGEKNKKVVF